MTCLCFLPRKELFLHLYVFSSYLISCLKMCVCSHFSLCNELFAKERERERRTIQLFRGHLFRDHPFRGQLFRGHLFRGHLFRGHLFRGHGGVCEDDRYKVCSQEVGMAECAERLE